DDRTHACDTLTLEAAVASLWPHPVQGQADFRKIDGAGHQGLGRCARLAGFGVAYMVSMSSRYRSCTTRRLTFSVGVSSPLSSVKSCGSSRKYLIDSQLPKSWFSSSIDRCTIDWARSSSTSTSGWPDMPASTFIAFQSGTTRATT